MLSLYAHEFEAANAKENTPISSIPNDDLETLNRMNNLISVLGNLSMFYTYNTNWGNKNLPGYSKIEPKGIDETTKSRQATKNVLATAGTYTFHLSMPYTHEVNI